MINYAGRSDFSTHDWFAINTDSIEQTLLWMEEHPEVMSEIFPENGGIEIPEWICDPGSAGEEFGIELFVEPDADDYYDGDDRGADYAHDHQAWEAYMAKAKDCINERESREFQPMWGTLFRTEDHPDIREAVFAVGLRIFEHEGADGIFIGVDSAGHSFYESYWIELRARIAAHSLKKYDETGERRTALVKALAEEWVREGHGSNRDGRTPLEQCVFELNAIIDSVKV